MDWVKLSSTYYLDPAVSLLPDAETEMMFVRGLAYCGNTGSGGLIPATALRGLSRTGSGKKQAENLVKSGLWSVAPSGFFVRSWEDWQKAQEDITARRRADRERKARSREALRSRDRSRDIRSLEGEREEEQEKAFMADEVIHLADRYARGAS